MLESPSPPLRRALVMVTALGLAVSVTRCASSREREAGPSPFPGGHARGARPAPTPAPAGDGAAPRDASRERARDGGSSTTGSATGAQTATRSIGLVGQVSPAPPASIAPGRGRWRPIPKAPDPRSSRQPAVGLAVGRHALAYQRDTGWAASYDPCAARWRAHDPIRSELARAQPVAIDDAQAAFCCAPPDRSGLLVDPRQRAGRRIPPTPKTPYPGRHKQALPDGLLIPTDKRLHVSRGRWVTMPYDETIFPAVAQQSSAVASGGDFFLSWGGGRASGGPYELYPGGAVFEARRDRWRLVATAGAPSPRRDAVAVWTGGEFFVYGGEAVVDGRGAGTLIDGGRYDPARDVWRAVAPGPGFAGPVQGVAQGGVVYLWDAERGGAYDLQRERWQLFGVPAKVPAQRRLAGHGRVAVITDTRAFVLDPAADGLRWREHALPRSVQGRDRRVELLTRAHLVIWGGERVTGGGGCDNVPRGQGCDPYTETRVLHDGAALALAPCR